MVLIVNKLPGIYEKVSGVKSRTLFSLLRITKIPTLEVDIEVNFEEGQNIFFFRESCFFASIVCLLIFLHYSYNVNLLWTRYYTDQSTLYFAVVSNILRSLAHQLLAVVYSIKNKVIISNYSGHRKTLSTAYLVSCGPPFVSGLKAD